MDYNRAGVPLIEIVSKPCIHSAKQASAYAMAVRAIYNISTQVTVIWKGIAKDRYQHLSQKKGETKFRNKVEIKNMNSFSFMEMAIESEVKRQIKEYESHPEKDPNEVIVQSTFRWDPEKKQTVLMRRKEGADDYRYFPEPDLPLY